MPRTSVHPAAAAPSPRVLRASVVAIAALWVLFGGVRAAEAHSALLVADPEPGSEMSILDAVQLRFDTPLIDDPRNRVWLQRSDGTADHRLGAIEFVSDREIRAALAELPPPGEYLVRYVLVSADADLNEGSYLIEITGEPSATGTFVLLGVGVAALAIVGVLLRPRGASGTRAET